MNSINGIRVKLKLTAYSCWSAKQSDSKVECSGTFVLRSNSFTGYYNPFITNTNSNYLFLNITMVMIVMAN